MQSADLVVFALNVLYYSLGQPDGVNPLSNFEHQGRKASSVRSTFSGVGRGRVHKLWWRKLRRRNHFLKTIRSRKTER